MIRKVLLLARQDFKPIPPIVVRGKFVDITVVYVGWHISKGIKKVFAVLEKFRIFAVLVRLDFCARRCSYLRRAFLFGYPTADFSAVMLAISLPPSHSG